MPLTDTALRMAQSGLYSPRWSLQIIEEARRNVSADGRNDGSRFDRIREVFPEAEVEGYEHLIDAMTNDPKDRHVLAAAIVGRADQIVTRNLKDFPDTSVEPYGIEVVPPDRFLMNVLDLFPDETMALISAQAAALRRGTPKTVFDVLRALARSGAPDFAQQMETIFHLAGTEDR
jgi:hypothetical protein